MTLRPLFPAGLGFIAGLMLAVGPSCGSSGPSTPGCGPDTCAGCCSAGKCITTPNNAKVATCGQNGVECANCGTRACTEFKCEGAGGGSGGACGPGNCGGCCSGTSATSTCINPATATNCGGNGAVCKSCSAGQACVAGDCKTLDGGAGQVGTPCTSDAECAALGAGSTCKKKTSSGLSDYVGGYCTKTCQTDQECPDKSLCLGPQPGYGEKDSICWAQCTTAAECRADDYDCYAIGGGDSACWIAPLPPFDPGPPADKVGKPCGTDATCKNPPEDGACLTDRLADGGPSAFADGYCTAECNESAHCSADGGAICISLGGFGACAQTCDGPGQGQGSCRTGYVCRSVRAGPDAGFLPVGFCWPTCKAAGCPTGTTCQATGYCG